MTEPTVFGRYELLRPAGKGGMAEVFVARQVGPGGFVKPCVLKRIAPVFSSNQNVLRMFREEARISALLNHPNIVQTFEFGDVDGAPYIAMELVDGVNLARMIRRLLQSGSEFPIRPAVEICALVLDALHYAHTLADFEGKPLKVVHRDVSPQNVLLSRQGSVKLADFGIARHEARDEATIGFQPKGKPGYMAPEQSLGHAVDHRADLYAVGVVLSEMVSGRRFHTGETPFAGLEELPRRITERLTSRKDVPRELVQAALHLTAPQPNDRPATAARAAEALRMVVPRIPSRLTLKKFLDRVFSELFDEEPEPVASDPTNVDPTAVAPVRQTIVGAPSAQGPGGTEIRPSAGASIGPGGPPGIGPGGEPSSGASAFGGPDLDDEGWPTGFRPEPASPRGPRVPAAAPAGPLRLARPGESPLDTGASAQKLMSALGADPRNLPPPPSREKRVKVYARKREGPWKSIGLAVIVGCGAIGWFVVRPMMSDGRVALARSGSLRVESTPPGAEILINNVPQAFVTPSEVPDLPVDIPLRVSLRRPGYVAVPGEKTVEIAGTIGTASVQFSMKRGVWFQLSSAPTRATIRIDGKPLAELTPTILPGVPMGEKIAVEVSRKGYLPERLELFASVETATIVHVELDKAISIEVSTEPPGAEIFVNGESQGVAPLYDLEIPKSGGVLIEAKLAGYRTAKKRVRAKSIRNKRVRLELDPVPIAKLALTAKEKSRLVSLQKRIGQLDRKREAARRRTRRSKKELDRLRDSPRSSMSAEMAATQAFEDARSDAERYTVEIEDARQEISTLRRKVVERLEAGAGR